jgi:cell division protein FtsA
VRNPIHSTGVGLLLFGREHQATGGTRLPGDEGKQGLWARMKAWFNGQF